MSATSRDPYELRRFYQYFDQVTKTMKIAESEWTWSKKRS